MDDYDVAIVGYGPTGMTLAALLGHLGHRVVVIERYAGLYNLPRAACFDDEIMRTFQKLGLVDEMSSAAEVQRGYEWVNAAGETLVDFEYDNPAPGGWAALYMMFQPYVEAVLDRHIKALPTVDVRQGIAVTDIEQTDHGVTLRGSGPDGDAVSIRARYAVGADGGNGFTRRSVCDSVDDYGFQENWLVCDFRLNDGVTLPRFRQVCDPAQPMSIVNIGPGHHRFSFMLGPGETADKATKHQGVWSRVSRYLQPADAEIIRAANYVFRSRLARQWRYGRILLAGDAAHEMPPFLAQGMCSGIRDSHNLAWKLDLILRGKAGDGLLDSYQAEREPHVRFITEKAIELGRVQTMRDPIGARERDERLLARRRANQGPEKLRYPGLSGGLIAGSGDFFPQGNVSAGHATGLLDDMTGAGWCIVAKAGALDKWPAECRTAWAAFDGHIADISITSGDDGLGDIDHTYAKWFEAHACSIAVVRPDWYVYGTARDCRDLQDLLDRLDRSLMREPDRIPA